MTTDVLPTRTTIVLHVVNPHSFAVPFVLEPWGESYQMPPHASFRVVGDGPSGDGPEVTIEADAITVWGWAGSVLRVEHATIPEAVARRERVPMPAMDASPDDERAV